jgi:hypothetical protein
MWSGDAEPIPFPFWFGPVGRVQHMAFDLRNEWLLVSGPHGLLHALKLDGRQMEVLPRGLLHSQALQKVDAVLGVADGFVVAGRIAGEDGGEQMLAFHYRFAKRVVKALHLGLWNGGTLYWFYFPKYHSIVARQPSNRGAARAVDLETERQFPPDATTAYADAEKFAVRACAAFKEAANLVFPPPRVSNLSQAGLRYEFSEHTGALHLQGADPPWTKAIPLSDGKPLLAGLILRDVQFAGSTLAISAWLPADSHTSVLLLRGPTCTPVATLPIFRDLEMRLSDDGRFIAVPTNSTEVTVFPTSGGQPPAVVMPKGRIHNTLSVVLAENQLLVTVGHGRHSFRWDRGLLEHRFAPSPGGQIPEGVMAIPTRGGSLVYDPVRFPLATPGRLRLLVDAYGNLIFQNSEIEALVAMLTVRKGRAAGWLPDGTRWGDSSIHGPASPNAAERMANALRGRP